MSSKLVWTSLANKYEKKWCVCVSFQPMTMSKSRKMGSIEIWTFNCELCSFYNFFASTNHYYLVQHCHVWTNVSKMEIDTCDDSQEIK